MREWYRRNKRVIWWVAIAGVPIGYLGIWLDSTPVAWAGILLALPLFVIVLPFCLFLLAALLTRPLWFPFYWLVTKRNGAPFHSGDLVRILRGPHRGKVVPVYEVWTERDQVRVELGDKEKDEMTDVFSFVSVRKERKADNAPHATVDCGADAAGTVP